MSYEEGVPHLRDLVAMLRRRWKLVAGSALCGALLAFFIGASMAPQYTAKAQLLVARSDAGPADVFDEAVVDTHVELILSPSHLREVQKSLAKNPVVSEINLPGPSATRPLVDPAQHGWLLEFAGGMFAVGAGDERTASQTMASAADDEPVPAIPIDFEMLKQNVNVFKEQRSRVIAVTFTAEDPQLAAIIASRVAEIYVELGRDRLQARRERLERELAERIPVARAALERAEAAVRDHRMVSGLLDQNSVDAMDRQIAELRRQLAVDQSRLPNGEGRLALLRHPQALGSGPEQLSESLGNLRAAMSAGGERRTNLGLEPAGMTASSNAIDEPFAKPFAHRDALSERLHRTRERLKSLEWSRETLREAEATLSDLEREAAASAQLYETLLRRQTELAVQDRFQQEIHIVSAASSPELPSSPAPILFVLPAFVSFAIGGGITAVVLERLDRRIRSEREVEESLGISCIGVVPAIPRFQLQGVRHALVDKPFNIYAEAIRSVVAIALWRRRVPGRQQLPSSAVFAVTSSEQGEGKTTLAVGFAVSAGMLGRRVLLIDLDFRNPGVAAALGAALTKAGPAERAIKRIAELGIDYVSLADRHKNALSFLSTNQFSPILENLKASYDCIVIDSPPLLEAAEARAIVSVADIVIFALKWSATEVDIARRALHQLRHAGIKDAPRRVLGVITQVKVREHAFYHR